MEFLYYFDEVFTLWAFSMLLLGTVFGLILGATPACPPQWPWLWLSPSPSRWNLRMG